VRYSLPHHEKALHIDMVVDKEYVTTAEAVYVVFPLQFERAQFHLDLNGVPLAPIDSPLIQVGGITTARWAHHLDTRHAALVSWALHNHWDTNFKASQGEDILLRYGLTSRAGYDPAASSRLWPVRGYFRVTELVSPSMMRWPPGVLSYRKHAAS
jgi:hypothetical protein